MADNIHEKNFVALAKKLGIPVKHGWKTALQKRLKQINLSIITNWIARGVPDDFHHILENAGIDPAIWREIVADNKIVNLSFDPHNTVSVRQKGGTFKLMPMGKRLREALDELIATRPQMKESEYLFANPKTGEPIANIRPALRKLCQKAGVVKHVTPHLFRHSIATHLMGAGMNARIVQGFMGHADIETTEFYTHVAAKHLMGAANMVDEMLMNRGLSTQTPRRQKARQRGRS